MTYFLSQLSAASAVIDGVTYPLDDYPSAYIDYVMSLEADVIGEIISAVERDGYTPDTAPTRMISARDSNQVLLAGKPSFPHQLGEIKWPYIAAFDDGTLIIDGDTDHEVQRAISWCQANVRVGTWALDISGYDEDYETAEVWFWFSDVNQRNAFARAFPKVAN